MLIPIGENIVEIVHNYVVTQLGAERGIIYFGNVIGAVEKAFYEVYGEPDKYPSVLEKAGILLHSLSRSNCYVDGNKRTALLATYMFLLYNGYSFDIPKDSANFIARIADSTKPNAPTEEDVIKWVKAHTITNRILRFIYNWILSPVAKRGNLSEITQRILHDLHPYYKLMREEKPKL